MYRSHGVWLYYAGSRVRQTRAQVFSDDRPGRQAVSYSELWGFCCFLLVTNRRRWWPYCSPYLLWDLSGTVEREGAKETWSGIHALGGVSAHCTQFKKFCFLMITKSQVSPHHAVFTTRFSCWDLWKQRFTHTHLHSFSWFYGLEIPLFCLREAVWYNGGDHGTCINTIHSQGVGWGQNYLCQQGFPLWSKDDDEISKSCDGALSWLLIVTLNWGLNPSLVKWVWEIKH